MSVSLCYCTECQKRTGSPFGEAAFFQKNNIKVTGSTVSYTRAGESGKNVKHYFCPTCGSTVYWEPELKPGVIAVAVGCFANPSFQPPTKSFHLAKKPAWLNIT